MDGAGDQRGLRYYVSNVSKKALAYRFEKSQRSSSMVKSSKFSDYM